MGSNGRQKKISSETRGFCAGVVRAIDVVRIALDLYGAPIHVRKEIVHTATWSTNCAAPERSSWKNWARFPKAHESFSAPMGFRPPFAKRPNNESCKLLTRPVHW